jgi:chromosome partitioning protein
MPVAAPGVLAQRSRGPRAASSLLRREAGAISRRPDEAAQVDNERTGGFLSKLLAALGLRRPKKITDQAGERDREQGTSARPASPPATTETARTTEGSTAGETSGHHAVAGPAQDDETPTADQSRELPYGDTEPRQDPAESRLDPIWGSDLPDALRGHMGMTTYEEAATAHAQGVEAQPRENGSTEPAEADSGGSSTAGGGAERAALPTEPHTEHTKWSAATSQPPHHARSEAGWFSAESSAGEPGAAPDNGALSRQLSTERPSEGPPQDPVAEMQWSDRAPDDLGTDAYDTPSPSGAESSTEPGSSGIDESSAAVRPMTREGFADGGSTAGPGEPMNGIGFSSSTIGPDATERPFGFEGSTTTGDAGEPVGMGGAANELGAEARSLADVGGTPEVRGAGESRGATEPGAHGTSGHAADPGDAEAGSVEAEGTAGDGDTAEAGGATGPADAAGASFDPAIDLAPLAEPSLPMSWPPGMTPPVRVETRETLDDDAGDSELKPRPDPTWPRLFAQGHEAQDRGGTGDLSNRRQEMGSPQEINDVQSSDHAAEPSYSQQEEPVSESGDERDARSSTGEPEGQAHIRDDQGTSQAASALDDPARQSTDLRLVTPDGVHALERSDVVPGGSGEGPGPSEASGGADGPPNRNASIVDVTTRESASATGAGAQPGPVRAAAEARVLDAGAATASGAEGGVVVAGNASMATGAPSAEVEEGDSLAPPASPRGVDVSRETSADGGEAMDPGREDEALEDEAAIAVRDAASRAAAEARADVSRETDALSADVSIDEPSPEVAIDGESAARNARVSFRIHHDTENGMRRVLAIANQKGGVGKSTTAVNIGAYLALAGAHVLVIDLDPQGNASTGLGLDHREIEPSIYDVLAGEASPVAAIRATEVPNLHVLPSTIDLAGAEVELVSAMSRETRLRRALESIDHQYETILIDCPPSLGLLTVNALAAADELLIPIQCEYYALEGLGQLLRNVELVRANLNPDLRIGGIVLTMYDGRTRLALQVVDEVRKHFTDIVYQTVVPRSVRLSEAPGYGLPIALYDPLSRGGIAYRDLTFEFAERSGLLAPTGEGAS